MDAGATDTFRLACWSMLLGAGRLMLDKWSNGNGCYKGHDVVKVFCRRQSCSQHAAANVITFRRSLGQCKEEWIENIR